MRDLVVLVADDDAAVGIATLLAQNSHFRHREQLGPFSFDPSLDLILAKNHDGSVYRHSASLLRAAQATHRRALACVDCDFGAPQLTATHIRLVIRGDLVGDGWDRANIGMVVFDPEVEVWLWQNRSLPALDRLLNWDNRNVWRPKGFRDARDWLARWPAHAPRWPRTDDKPKDPKGLLHALLREGQKRSTPNLFSDAARHFGATGCRDAAYRTFCRCLKRWFP